MWDALQTHPDYGFSSIPEDPSEGLHRCTVTWNGSLGEAHGERCRVMLPACSTEITLDGGGTPSRAGNLGSGLWTRLPQELGTLYGASLSTSLRSSSGGVTDFRFDRVVPGLQWAYLKVGNPLDAGELQERCSGSAWSRALWTYAFHADQTGEQYAWLCAPTLRFAAYAVRNGAYDYDGYTYPVTRIRFWLGVSLYPSIFGRFTNEDRVQTYADLPEYAKYDGTFRPEAGPDSYVERDQEHALARARAYRTEWFLACVKDIEATISWSRANAEEDQADSTAECDFIERSARYPCWTYSYDNQVSDQYLSVAPTGSTVTSAFYDFFRFRDPCLSYYSAGTAVRDMPAVNNFFPIARCGFEENGDDNRVDLSGHVSMWGGGVARSLLGTLLTGEVLIRRYEGEAENVTDLVHEGFACLFGDNVPVELSIRYLPHGEDELATARIRHCITNADLEPVEDLVARVRALRDGLEGYYVFNAHDADLIEVEARQFVDDA